MMACCSGKYFLLTTCVIQLIATVQRQIFDFLGYMWAPIFANFLQLIVVILGFFGAYQYRPKYILVYAIWMFLWIGWNAFVICFYLEAGSLDRNSSILNMGTGSRSWWEVNGSGCHPVYNFTGQNPLFFPKPESVDGCILEYYYVECIQAGLQCLLAVLGFAGACYIFYVFNKEDDSFDFIGGFDSLPTYHSPPKASHMHLQPIYTKANSQEPAI